MSDVTELLNATARGDRKAAAELLPLVYDELRKLAAAKLAHEAAGQTLSGTALVHEAFLRLVGEDDRPRWETRAHFFAAAAEAMRRLLVENARRKQARRHGGSRRRVDLEALEIAAPEPPGGIVALDEALTRFAALAPECAELIRLRYFVGMTIDEAAAVLNVSPATAKRHWAYGRAWLHRAIAGASEDEKSSDS